jgi:hypothetical protein
MDHLLPDSLQEEVLLPTPISRPASRRTRDATRHDTARHGTTRHGTARHHRYELKGHGRAQVRKWFFTLVGDTQYKLLFSIYYVPR